MAKFRKVFTAFWDDLYIEKQSPEDRYFYLFLLTNPLCTECGIYQISINKMCSYTGYNQEAVSSIIERLSTNNKVVYNRETCEIAILNKMKYLDRLGKPILDCLISELKRVKDIELIKKLGDISDNQQVKDVFSEQYTIRCKQNNDTLTYREPTAGQEEEEEKEKEEDKKKKENRSEPPNPILISNLNRQPNIPTKEKVWEVFSMAGGSKEMAKSFYQKHEGTGWFLNGSPITNFAPLANKFIDNWKKNETKDNPKDSANVQIKLK